MQDDTGRAAAETASLPPNASLEHLRKQAKRRLREMRATDPDATLATAQRALARDYGFPSWRRLKAHLDSVRGSDDLPSPWAERVSAEVAAALRRGDRDAAERSVRQALERHPDDEELLAYAADLAFELRGDAAAARVVYDRLLVRPNAGILTHYAAFLASAGDADADALEDLHRRAIAMDGSSPEQLGFALNNYAGFLERRRKDPGGAERLLRRAAALDHPHPRVKAGHLGMCGAFLWRHGRAGEAEDFYRRARALSRKEGLTALEFAGLLTATGRTGEGLDLVREALASPSLAALYDPTVPAMVGCFLVYAHGAPPRRAGALRHLKAALSGRDKDCRGPMDLHPNAKAAAAAGHPAPGLLRALADLLSDGAAANPAGAAAALARHPAWTSGA